MSHQNQLKWHVSEILPKVPDHIYYLSHLETSGL